MDAEEKRIRNLELIQGIINRMAKNSFLLKGWSVVLVSALFALGAKDSTSHYVYLTYLPAIVFWGLDGYFLRQEKLFRNLYDSVRLMELSLVDFSMNTKEIEKTVDSWSKVVLSRTLISFHGIVLLAIIIVMILQFI